MELSHALMRCNLHVAETVVVVGSEFCVPRVILMVGDMDFLLRALNAEVNPVLAFGNPNQSVNVIITPETKSYAHRETLVLHLTRISGEETSPLITVPNYSAFRKWNRSEQ